MGKKYMLVTLLGLMVFTFSCFENDNPFDENGTNYTPPQITINEDASSIKNRDTIHFDSIVIALVGNREESLFNLKIDTGEWMENWEPEGGFVFSGISDGKHMLYINSMYQGGKRVVSDSLVFYVLTKGYKPEFKQEEDTAITLFEGRSLTLSVHAEEAPSLVYLWMKGSAVHEGQNIDTLKFSSFSVNDTASYKCIVSNEYGKDTSRTFTLKHRPFSGGIKGVVADSSGNKLKNATVTLSPSDKKDTTDAAGSFTFSSLSGNTYTLKINLPEYRDTTLSEIAVNDSETIVLPTITLKMIAAATFRVAYNGNGSDTGTVPVDSNSYYKSKEVTVAGNPGNLYRDGYSFSGWNTKADGTGETYNAGAKFAMPDSAMTLYAKWTTNITYSIIYHSATSTDGDVPATVNADSGMQVTIADSGSLYKTGYTFVGWNIREDGSGKTYKTGDKVTMDTVNVDLYSQWTKAQYTVTYHGNGNTGGTVPPATKHFYGSEIVLEAPGTLQKTGYTFFKWNTDSLGNGVDFSQGNKVTISVHIDLYARWNVNEYSIVFNTSGGSTLNNQTVKYGDTVVIPAVPLKNSYVFDGWHKDSTCTEKWNFASTTINTNATLYAKWVIKDIDENIYTEVKVGSQVWMVENLKTTRFNTGSTIPLVVDSSLWQSLLTPGYCWYYNDTIYKALYGALYNWYTVESGNLAPSGWHVPTENEWKLLEQYLIANGYNWDASTTDNKIAKSLAAKARWEVFEQPGSIGYDIESNNKSGFSAFPSGFRNNNGTFQYLLSDCYWWSTTEKSLNAAWSRTLNNFDQFFAGFSMDKVNGFSVRCIRDY